ncbi:MAG: Trp family transcriptional regulator [Candidatus Curtissbacteria bacterium]|nr:Trp family transcriptional regulator [Candidatus Curtissbacteria bacterium]
MGRVSKRKINPQIEERIFEIFRDYLATLKTPLGIKEFLQSLLSNTEQVMLSKRLAIAVLLARGFNYEEIDETLKVSKSTVGMVHRQISTGAQGYQKAIKHVLAQEKNQKFWNNLEELLIQLSPQKMYGSSAWQRKSQASKVIARRKRQLEAL